MTRYYYHIVVLMSLLLGLQTAGFAGAEEDKTVITAGPSWNRFTNEDGHGLYHDIIQQVFSGYQVKHLYVSSEQANAMVAIGRADIKMCETKQIESLILSSVPMYENDYYVLFLQESINKWEGDESLRGKKIAWREGYYSNLDFSVPVEFIEVRSGESALKMVMHGRAVFYVDDYNLIRQSFEKAGETFDPEKFGVERVGTRKYFPVFANTPAGLST